MRPLYSWNSLNDFFDCLNQNAYYVILRNFETINSDYISQEHPDIDILCHDRKAFVGLSKSVSRNSNTHDLVHRAICINNHIVDLDVRCVGDGYYDSNWEEEILRTRQLYHDNFYVPNNENYYYSLLYHALFQKKQISSDYTQRLSYLANRINLVEASGISIDTLQTYMRKKGYLFTYPENPITIANFNIVDKSLIKRDYFKHIQRKRFKFHSIIKKILKIWEKK